MSYCWIWIKYGFVSKIGTSNNWAFDHSQLIQLIFYTRGEAFQFICPFSVVFRFISKPIDTEK